MATIRGAVECLTCGQPHILRIGMGQETTHEHRFECRQCKEPLVAHLDVDYENVSATIRCGENAKLTQELQGSPIVNLDANFAIGDEEQGKDMVFPRMRQLQKMFREAEAAGRLGGSIDLSAEQRTSRPYRRPDYSAEWQHLRKAWSLARNGKDKLSKRAVDSASREFYSSEPLGNLADWIWRLAMFMCQPSYEKKLREAIDCLKLMDNPEQINALKKYYNSEMSEQRAAIYLESMKEFFSGYTEFAQVYFFVSRGSEVPVEYKVTSHDFDRVKMSYGNLFEAFTSLVEFPALLNNILLGRNYDQFEKLTFDAYKKLDKAARIGPLSMTPALLELCEEADNQLRNASHHGGIQFNSENQTISYRAGKGGLGDEKEMTYTQYLTRCVRLFLQILTLLRIELLLCQSHNMRYPI